MQLWGLGGCRGRGRRIRRAPMTAPSQPIEGSSPPLAPPSRWTMRPILAGGAQPCLAALPVLGWSQPGYFWPLGASSKSQQDVSSVNVLPSMETPRATSSVPRRCPSSLENLPLAATAAFSVFPNPRASPPCCRYPWEELWVPGPMSCPHHSQPIHGSGDNVVTAKRNGQK